MVGADQPRLDAALRRELSQSTIHTGRNVASVDARGATLEGGERIEARCVIDARGFILGPPLALALRRLESIDPGTSRHARPRPVRSRVSLSLPRSLARSSLRGIPHDRSPHARASPRSASRAPLPSLDIQTHPTARGVERVHKP